MEKIDAPGGSSGSATTSAAADTPPEIAPASAERKMAPA